MTKKESLQKIFETCWEQLMQHKYDAETNGEDIQLYFQNKDTLTYQGFGDDKEITEEEGRVKLRELIENQYKKYGWVYMYTCPDNSLISIDDLKDMDEGEKEMMELQEGYGDIEFRIGFD